MQSKTEAKELISPHRVRCYIALKASQVWLSNDDIARIAGVSNRCARSYTKRFVDSGIAERMLTFPGHKFRLLSDADSRCPWLIRDIEHAAGAIGIKT